jgi:quinol monooxygenase YgiN
MKDSRRHFIQTTGAAALVGSTLGIPAVAGAQSGPGGFVLAVELEIVPSELENFRAAIKENGQAAVREEPGCRQFNIASQKDDPTRILLFEVYDNAEAFAAHQATPHFKKYAATTANMVKSRKRIEMIPISLYAKARG